MASQSASESRIFENYRVIGLVSNKVPCLVRYIHKRRENFVISCAGKFINTYASKELRLISASKELPDDIKCMTSDTYHVYTASGSCIYAWRRGTELKHTYIGHNYDIKCLLTFGEHLYSIDQEGHLIKWNIKTEEKIWTHDFNIKFFTPTVIMHPATYINKIIIGSLQGVMEIWNVERGELVYRSKPLNSSISFIIQAPVVDVVAICTQDKQIILYNIKYDEKIFKIKCEEMPTSLAFRTDKGMPLLIVGGINGAIISYDMETKSIVSYVSDAHNGPVTGLQFFSQEPIFASSSAGNSLKIWIFDMPDGSFRLYNSRDGHFKPSNKIRFHDNSDRILSAGQDSTFRIFHMYNDAYNICTAKKYMKENKMTDFVSEISIKHHANMAACHLNDHTISTWNYKDNSLAKVSDLKFSANKKSSNYATALSITINAQFVVIGYSNGALEKFNMQSGKHRMTYGDPAHNGTIRGIAIDNVNSIIVSGGTDCILRIWNFDNRFMIKEINFESGISFINKRSLGNLIAIILDNFSIVIFDLESRIVVRKFTGISSPIQDVSFSHNFRWLTASSEDGLIRTWDIPTTNLIDVFRVESIVKSLSYSPNGQFLAGVISDSVGVSLWINKSLFEQVSLTPLPYDFEPSSTISNENESYKLEMMDDYEYESPLQIENSITLSNAAESSWKSLLNLDLIKAKNKPKEPAKLYVAPFFLDSYTTVDTKGAMEMDDDEKSSVAITSKVVKLESKLTKFGEKLIKIENNSDIWIELCNDLNAIGPSKIDLEIRSLGLDNGGSEKLLNCFIKFLIKIYESKTHYAEFLSYLGLFLKVHGEELIDKNYSEGLETLRDILENNDNVIKDKIISIFAYNAFIKSTLI